MTSGLANNKGSTFLPRRQVLLLNLMPTKAKTFGQFNTLLNDACNTDVISLHVDTHKSRTTKSKDNGVSSISWRDADPTSASGLIITGAPLEHLDFQDVDYWQEFSEIIQWASQNIPKRLYICWAAQAVLYLKHGLKPEQYENKLSGIFTQQLVQHSPLVKGLGTSFQAPVSRYTGIASDAIEALADIDLIAVGHSNDVCLAESQNGDTYMMNHLEYDALSLGDEFRRDIALGRSTSMPRHYFPNDDRHATPNHHWLKTAKTFFANWLGKQVPNSSHIDVLALRTPLLLTPGPLPLSEHVKQQMLVDHGSRSQHIKRVTQRVRQNILTLAGGNANHTVVPLQGSGSFAMEGVLRSFMTQQSRPLVIVNGNYGKRIVSMLARQGITPVVLTFPVDAGICLNRVKNTLSTDTAITHMIFVHCETTTGIWNPYQELLELATQHGVLSVVDSMSGFGCLPIDARADNFDFLISSGNKCVEAPPGIAFVIAKRRHMEETAHECDSYCLDLIDQWRVFESSGQWRTTPPVHVLQALDAALQDLETETVKGRRIRYQALADRIEAGMCKLGFTPLLISLPKSPGCLSFYNTHWLGQEGARYKEFHTYLELNGYHLYANMHEETGSFRIGCMGQIKPESAEQFLEVVHNYVIEFGLCEGSEETTKKDIKPSGNLYDRELDIA